MHSPRLTKEHCRLGFPQDDSKAFLGCRGWGHIDTPTQQYGKKDFHHLQCAHARPPRLTTPQLRCGSGTHQVGNVEGREEADKPFLALLLQGVVKGSFEGLRCPHNLQAALGEAGKAMTGRRGPPLHPSTCSSSHAHCHESALLSWDAWRSRPEEQVTGS